MLSRIYYAGGDYSITQQVSLSSISIPIKINGGYAATTDGSLERGNVITKLSRNTSYNIRLLIASSTSSIEINDITLSDGRLVSANAAGAAAYFTACSKVTLSNCTVSSCTTLPSGSNQNIFGGGIYAINCNISFLNCVFSENRCGQGGTNVKTRGGALFVQKCSTLIDNCNFINNKMQSSYNNGAWGGAIFTTGGDITIINSQFIRNKCANESTFAGGGTLALRGMSRALLKNNYFENCYANLGKTPSKTPASVSEAILSNVTIADGNGVGVYVTGSGAGLFVKNSVIWGNTTASLSNPTAVEYSCLQEEHQGEGNIVADPVWTGYPYYHLKSRNAGSYITDEYFGGSFNNEKQKA